MPIRSFAPGLCLLVLLLAAPAARAQQGLVIAGVGPVNRSMGGASTAAPIDAAGALYWNPASISGLGHSEMEFGIEFLYPRANLSSHVAANNFGPGTPPVPLAGSTSSDSGVFPLPSFGLVYQPKDSCWTFGVGLAEVGGFAVNYPTSAVNPFLSAQPPRGLGVGNLFTQYQIIQMTPTASYQITEHLSVGLGLTGDLAGLLVDPFVFASPDDANGDGFRTFPAGGTHSRLHWGVGVQGGLFWAPDQDWSFGVSVKSPQWFERFAYQGVDELGRRRDLRFDFDYPMIVSVGAAYTGLEDWLFAADVRYLDYRNTEGYHASGLDATGALRGLGWDSIFALALGAQYQASDRLSLRVGYVYNPNPIPDRLAALNAGAPTILMHTLSSGASFRVTDALLVSLAYTHSFENAIHGPFITPLGPVPGTEVRSSATADSVVLGATVRF